MLLDTKFNFLLAYDETFAHFSQCFEIEIKKNQMQFNIYAPHAAKLATLPAALPSLLSLSLCLALFSFLLLLFYPSLVRLSKHICAFARVAARATLRIRNVRTN